jgi:hypothetical protein
MTESNEEFTFEPQDPSYVNLGGKMTESNEKELEEKIKDIACEEYRKCNICPIQTECNEDMKQIITLCRTHFGIELRSSLAREFWEKIKTACEGHIDVTYGDGKQEKYHTDFMHIKDIKRILMGEGEE